LVLELFFQNGQEFKLRSCHFSTRPHGLYCPYYGWAFRTVSDHWFVLSIYSTFDSFWFVVIDVIPRGLATTTALAAKNAKVYIAARSRKKAEEAIKGIKETQRDAKVEVVEMDLADLESVKKGAEEFLRCVHVLFYFVQDLMVEKCGAKQVQC
jgi:hypothetical protein